MDLDAEIHRQVLDALITRAAPASATFGDLLVSLAGTSPADAAASLERLAAQRLIDPVTTSRLSPYGQAFRSAGRVADDDHGLPAPHPADYDWRFSTGTADRLAARCVQLSNPSDTIALLGTPTMLRTSANCAQDRRWRLLEANAAITSALEQLAPGSVMCCDLARDQLPDLEAQVVVADPPWYPEHTRVFLWAAACMSEPGATILLAQPGVGTRPGILAERARLLAYAAECGLRAACFYPGTLEYVCPPFERRALECCGLAGSVPVTWRHGDLIELARELVRLPVRPAVPDVQQWSEVVVDGVRLRFRRDRHREDDETQADPRLVHLVDKDILPSVSRRDPVRQHVAVWTASNRVFGCRSPDLLAVIADAFARSLPADDAASNWLARSPRPDEQAHIRQAVAQLTELVRAEHATGAGAATISASLTTRPDSDVRSEA